MREDVRNHFGIQFATFFMEVMGHRGRPTDLSGITNLNDLYEAYLREKSRLTGGLIPPLKFVRTVPWMIGAAQDLRVLTCHTSSGRVGVNITESVQNPDEVAIRLTFSVGTPIEARGLPCLVLSHDQRGWACDELRTDFLSTRRMDRVQFLYLLHKWLEREGKSDEFVKDLRTQALAQSYSKLDIFMNEVLRMVREMDRSPQFVAEVFPQAVRFLGIEPLPKKAGGRSGSTHGRKRIS